eukprot:1374564-Amorphochlora_amoeboformis.AAC.1
MGISNHNGMPMVNCMRNHHNADVVGGDLMMLEDRYVPGINALRVTPAYHSGPLHLEVHHNPPKRPTNHPNPTKTMNPKPYRPKL